MDWCDFATRDENGAQNAGAFIGGANPRGVLHTTEGTSYSGARSAFAANNSWPHFTITGESGSPSIYQHLPVSVAARSLEHRTGTVETNRQGSIQIEIVGYAKDAPAFSKVYLDGVAKLMRWIEANCGVEKTCSVTFVIPGHEQRLTDDAWLQYRGWCGHQHVPHNSHEDPGAIDIAYLLNTSVASLDVSDQRLAAAQDKPASEERTAVPKFSVKRDPQPKPISGRLIIGAISLTAAIIAVAATNNFGGIKFQDDIGGAATKLVTALLVVTIFVERSTAVLASMWFAPDIAKARAVQATAHLRNDIVADDSATMSIALLVAQQNQSRQLFALIIAALVAVVGPRTLQALLVFPPSDSVAKALVSVTQTQAFYAVDMLITAGLIAGGSDGIHQIANLLAQIFNPPKPGGSGG